MSARQRLLMSLLHVLNLHTFTNYNFTFKFYHETKYHKSVVNFKDYTLQYLINPWASAPKSPTRAFPWTHWVTPDDPQPPAYIWRPFNLKSWTLILIQMNYSLYFVQGYRIRTKTYSLLLFFILPIQCPLMKQHF